MSVQICDPDTIVLQLQEAILNRPRNVTYDDIGEATGVSVRYIQDLANDRIANPRFSEVVKLWAYFNKQTVMDLSLAS